MQKLRNDDNVFCTSVTTYMESLLSQRDFVAAVEYYEAYRSLMATAGNDLASAFGHQAARAYASVADYAPALKAARAASALASSEGDSLRLAEIFLTLGGILRDMGEQAEAGKAYRDAESIFRRNDCPEGQSRALNSLAGLHFRRTDYRNALRILMDAVEIAKRLDDRQKLAFMMGNIGRLHTFLGDFDEAERHLKINVDLSGELGDELEEVRARLSLGYVYLQAGQFEAAEAEFLTAYPMIVALKAASEETIYLTYLGELMIATGRTDEAQPVLSQALARAEQVDPESTMTGRVLRQLAELNIHTANYRRARKLAARSQVIMKRAGDQVAVGALMKIMAQVTAAAAGSHRQPQALAARQLFQEAIDTLDQAGVRFEKAAALEAAGNSAVFDERQRMTYLFRAEEFYARSGRTIFQERVSRQINELGQFAPTPKVGQPTRRDGSHDYLTCSSKIERIKDQLSLLTNSELPVLITGDTGVGKDHLARYFHSLVRPDGPYIAVNCASVPETLLESELFGYRKGAFTGADQSKPGHFEAANGGVFLLDEIGDMPLMLQAKLLGVLESRQVTPLGSTTPVDIDIVLVAATNRNLEEMVERGTFRRDLYYRLTGIRFHLPSLEERKEDIPLLLEHFMARRGLLKAGEKPSPDLLQYFLAHDWPGNVRELDNMVSRLEVMSQAVADGDLNEVARSILAPDQPVAAAVGLFDRVEQFERKLITEALLAAGGNKSEAARMLGIHEATVRTKLKRYGLSLEGARPN